MTPFVPTIDLSRLETDGGITARAIDAACRDHGFFVVTSHGVSLDLISDLDRAARQFFELPEARKAEISMSSGGHAWRGWFPVGGEVTSGVPDRKEGLYFGFELPDGDPRPMHGANQFPVRPAELRDLVTAYMAALTNLGHRLAAALDIGLGTRGALAAMTADPLVLFRIFGYPARDDSGGWGVGEHTDYGLLTMLHQDSSGGLQVRSGDDWIDVAPVEGSFVCNIGDMLEKATGGVYRSTPHRVRSPFSGYRVSMPFFFDPGWDVRVEPVAAARLGASESPTGSSARWDGADPLLFDGTYGEYVWSKVGKVFPELRG